jgi:hypothetical protein
MLKDKCFSLDLWSNIGSANARSSVIGYSINGGICGPNKYSINEFLGFSGSIYNAAHDLGHG